MFGFKTFTGCIAKNNMGSNATFQSKWDQKYLNTPSSYTPLPPPPKKNDAQLEITSYLDTSFSYWNSLLFHGFMDSHLIFRIHFVKFINAANTLQTNKKMKTPSSLSHLAGIHITNKILQILCFLATDSNYS